MEIKKINKFVKTSAQLGEIGLIIVEDGDSTKIATVGVTLQKMDYKRSKSYLELMDNLESKQPTFYIEPMDKLKDLIWNIVRRYSDGMVSLMDRENHTGLKTVHFLPKESPLILILTREQVDNSPQGLFKYVGGIESV